MGGAPLPTPSTPGYTSFRGFTCCDCLAQWLPVLERLMVLEGIVKSSIDIWQLTGAASASGGTHSQGGAFDIFQTSPEAVALCREMGAPATWARTVSQGFSKAHTHGVLSGCDHNAPAAYQIPAQKRGFNGLGYGYWNGQRLLGYGGKDTFPDPQTYRTWTQGITWAKARIAFLEDEMSFTDADRARLDATLSDADGATLRADTAWQNKHFDQKFAELAGLITTLTNAVSAVKTELDAVKAEVEALPKAPGA